MLNVEVLRLFLHVTAAIHQLARSNKAMLAVGGAMSSLFGAAAIWVDVAMPI